MSPVPARNVLDEYGAHANRSPVRLVTSAELGMHGEIDDIDPLTGAPGPMSLSRQYDAMLDDIRKDGDDACLAVISVDGLGTVNEEEGRAAGDRLLAALSHQLTRSLRGSDFVGRWDDNRFVVLFPRTPTVGGARALEKVLVRLRSVPSRGAPPLRFSAGVGTAEPGLPFREALREAESHLVRAREAGGARIVSVEAELVPRPSTVVLLEQDRITRDVLTHRLAREGLGARSMEIEAVGAALLRDASALLLGLHQHGTRASEVLGRIRREPLTARLPILVLSPTDNERVMRECFRAGADDYVVKPFSPSEVVMRLLRLLERQH